MRYQERIYIQTDVSAVRNKDILNVNMSSDMCIFEQPSFTVSGASKIDCGVTSGTSYVISSATTIPLEFIFTGNTDSFSANSANFRFEVYKYNYDINSFVIPPVFRSETFQYSAFSGTNEIEYSLPITNLNLDGEYLVKGYFQYGTCTEFLNKLGKRFDSSINQTGSQYGMYNDKFDYYFIAVKESEKPELQQNQSNSPTPYALYQQVILPTQLPNPNFGDDDTDTEFLDEYSSTLLITNSYQGDPVVTMNGLVLAKDYDYSLSGNLVTLSGSVVSDDIFTVIYVTTDTYPLTSDVINVDSPIVSGVTDSEGNNSIYFNTTTGKYEAYMSVTPLEFNSVILMLNGVTLANGIDFYQSTTNPKRIILEGIILEGDLITIVYFPQAGTINGLLNNSPLISWTIQDGPTDLGGYFSLEVSYSNLFDTFYYSGTTPYVLGQTLYYDSFNLTGPVGTKLWYRVKNAKRFVTFCGDIVESVVYSDVIPMQIQNNSINSY